MGKSKYPVFEKALDLFRDGITSVIGLIHYDDRDKDSSTYPITDMSKKSRHQKGQRTPRR